MDRKLYDTNPRSYALYLLEEGLVSPETMALMCLKALSWDDTRDMLDANELSPRFMEDEA